MFNSHVFAHYNSFAQIWAQKNLKSGLNLNISHAWVIYRWHRVETANFEKTWHENMPKSQEKTWFFSRKHAKNMKTYQIEEKHEKHEKHAEFQPCKAIGGEGGGGGGYDMVMKC